MSEPVTLPAPAVDLGPPLLTKWEREFHAFQDLLPQLLPAYRGQYVAIHEGKVVDTGPDKLALALRVLARIGNVPIHVGLVSPVGEPVSRSGVRRDGGSSGGTL